MKSKICGSVSGSTLLCPSPYSLTRVAAGAAADAAGPGDGLVGGGRLHRLPHELQHLVALPGCGLHREAVDVEADRYAAVAERSGQAASLLDEGVAAGVFKEDRR
jgi:hypothetical protein